MSCRRCGRAKGIDRRGLCRPCYRDKGARRAYDRLSHQQSPVPQDGLVPPAEPCPYPPGSPGKLAALERRAERGELLWHADDAADWAGVAVALAAVGAADAEGIDDADD